MIPQLALERKHPFQFLGLTIMKTGDYHQQRAEDTDRNPLTRLQGSASLERQMTTMLRAGQSFAVLYADLNHFKQFNDEYGVFAGNEIIKRLGEAMVEVLGEGAVAHIGGDDYIGICEASEAESAASRIIALFDHQVSGCTVAIGVVTVDDEHPFADMLAISLASAEVKHAAKEQSRTVSSYFINRRT